MTMIFDGSIIIIQSHTDCIMSNGSYKAIIIIQSHTDCIMSNGSYKAILIVKEIVL